MKSKYFAAGANIPKNIKNKTYHNLWYWHMDLYDAFNEAVRSLYQDAPEELQKAWYAGDLRAYIPSVYRPEYLDFTKHPLKYEA